MDHLNWELSVLSRAVAYSNLSGAASHVGVSQPQLSRIVAKLEHQYQVSLLDRDAKRKSSWTPAAFRLAEIYSTTVRSFQGEILRLAQSMEPDHLRVGTLEGLIGPAMDFCKNAFDRSSAQVLELVVADLNELEELYFKRTLDFLFTSREPGRKKFRYVRRLGTQILERTGNARGSMPIEVMSSFEFGAAQQELSRARHDPGSGSRPRLFVSNSLQVRKAWITRFGGQGVLPSDVRAESSGRRGDGAGEREVPALLIGSDDLPSKLWEAVSAFRLARAARTPPPGS